MRALPWLFGLLALAALAAGFLYPLGVLFHRGLFAESGTPFFSDPFFRHVLRFTYGQALVSAALSGLAGTALAFAVEENRFPGRRWIGPLSLLCFGLPPLLVALGFIGVWGRAGFGWPGILAAHVFLNFPLFFRGVGAALAERDTEPERAALSLGASRWTVFRRITWPAVAPEVQSAFALSFLFCSLSFLVVLFLGGGPRFTTLEVALYQAVKVEFDLPLAVRIAAVQLAVSAALYLFCLRSPRLRVPGNREEGSLSVYRWRTPGGRRLGLGALALALGAGVAAPLLSLGASGLGALSAETLGEIRGPALNSLRLASLAAAVTVALALPLAYLGRRAPAVGWIAGLSLSVSTLLFTLGLSVAFGDRFFEWRGNLWPVAWVQGVCALPLVYRILHDGLGRIPDEIRRAAASLGAGPVRRFFSIELPMLRRSLGLGAGIGAAYSLGEVGAVLLFLTEESETLPLWIFRLMGRYEFDRAYAGALALLALMALFQVIMSRGEKGDVAG